MCVCMCMCMCVCLRMGYISGTGGCQDKDDDAALQLKSTALWMGASTKPWLYTLALGSCALLGVAGNAAHMTGPFYLVSVAGSLGHMLWQIRTVDLFHGPDCMAKFVSNKHVGVLVLLGAVLDRLFDCW